MEELSLMRLGETHRGFLSYIPENFRPLLGRPDCVCVGAVFRSRACGVALAEPKPGSEVGVFYLRWIFVDPAARLCGLGSYLLRGLLGETSAAGAARMLALWSPSMTQAGHGPEGVLRRAGFSPPKPVATSFSVRLGDIAFPRTRGDAFTLYDAETLPEELAGALAQAAADGELPDFADVRRCRSPVPACCITCAKDGKPAGALCVERDVEGLFLRGVYVFPAHRGRGAASAMITAALTAARRLYPADTIVSTDTIAASTLELCLRLFGRKHILLKETELLATYRF